jgi:glycosyltransferase involved in cell wall biosynthesis
MKVLVVGTYPPTECGIATFTSDVESALRLNDAEVTVVPVSPLPLPTSLSIRRDDEDSYTAVGRKINELGCDVVLIQHEFGIFGDKSGANILALAAALEVPYVVTLHTVLPRFSDEQANVLHELCRDAAAVTVFTNTARRLVLEQDLAPSSRVHVVAHGAPPELYAASDSDDARDRFLVPHDVPVMSTFGLLSRGKGVELAIEAMALLNGECPDLHYLVAGRTHPEVVKFEGESYRASLEELAEQLGVADRVIFVDRFLDLEELADLLGISDVVCTPYRGEDQSVSGVLTFSLAAGCAVASTPYRYARDVLADGAGILSDFGDSHDLAESIGDLLHPETGNSARAAARRAASAMPWPTVGAALRVVLETAIDTQEVADSPHADWSEFQSARLPANHLQVLCDDTAIWQHAHYSSPRLEDGYCVDDAGRMLPIAARLSATTHDPRWELTTARLTAFLKSAAGGGNGQMRNFMSADHQWLDEPHVGDHLGRAIWGLGELVAAGGACQDDARATLEMVAPAVSATWPTKTLAYAALGLVAAAAVDCVYDDDLSRIVGTLHEWTPTRTSSWRWCESRLTYDNARLPEALIRVGHRLGDQHLLDKGLELLEWLDDLCIQGSYYRFPGHRGLSVVEQLLWSGDEQPLEASAFADAHLAALALCDRTSSADAIERAWTWFFGNNRAGQPLVHFASGACFDGLGPRQVNYNRGAESTIALHRCEITRTAGRHLVRARQATGESTSLVVVAGQ